MRLDVWILAYVWMALVAGGMCLGGNASRVCVIAAVVVAIVAAILRAMQVI